MADKVQFQGTVVRVERDGFGVIEFDQAIGANTHGIFSTTTSDPEFPFGRIKTGMHVSGVAEVDEKDIAAIKMVELAR